MNRQKLSFFDMQGLQLLLFGGKGGVGKTTCATAAALRPTLYATAWLGMCPPASYRFSSWTLSNA
jgi:hypothetical protein